MAFGPYDPLAETDVDAIGQVIYSCTAGGGGGGDGRGGGGDGRGGGGGGGGRGGGRGPGTRAQETGIRIEFDTGLSGAYLPRQMFGPGAAGLQYNIYLDATHQTVWGNGQGSTEVYVDLNPPIGTPVTVVAYGRIFRGQDVVAGQYGDSVAVRIQF
jgi:Spore Coat Protein U domain